MYTQTTDNIEITAVPEYIPAQSSPTNNFFVWSYNISIKNKSKHPVKLISRYWKIINSNGLCHEVKGKGVVGIQPIINPGETFEYSSGTHLNTPSGVMLGNYNLSKKNGKKFDVQIPTFSLDCPNMKKIIN